jgi:hypothetical protein
MAAVPLPVAAESLHLPEARPAARPYNVVIISIDTLGADHLGVYGYPRETSPAIDAFAADAVVFDSAYSQSPKTATSHMTLFTGLYPPSHEVVNWTANDDRQLGLAVPTLALLLERAGYRNEAFTGGGNVRGELGFARGCLLRPEIRSGLRAREDQETYNANEEEGVPGRVGGLG